MSPASSPAARRVPVLSKNCMNVRATTATRNSTVNIPESNPSRNAVKSGMTGIDTIADGMAMTPAHIPTTTVTIIPIRTAAVTFLA